MKAYVRGTNIELTIYDFHEETNGRAKFIWCECSAERCLNKFPVPAADIELR